MNEIKYKDYSIVFMTTGYIAIYKEHELIKDDIKCFKDAKRIIDDEK